MRSSRRVWTNIACFQNLIIKRLGTYPSKFNLFKFYNPPVKDSTPRNLEIARVLYLRKTIETWGRGLTRIVEECQRVGLPLPKTTVEHGNVVTIFKRPEWTRTGTPMVRTGTPRTITGTLNGARWVIGTDDPMSCLPKLRKDARANVEMVLSEIIADKCAGVVQICARTGMALRTINNAIVTLREAGIIQANKVNLGSDEVGGKGMEDGSKEGEVGSKIDFDIVLSNVRKDFRETCRRVWELLNQDETLLQQGVSERLNIALNSVQKAYAVLKNAGLLIKEGEGRGFTSCTRFRICSFENLPLSVATMPSAFRSAFTRSRAKSRWRVFLSTRRRPIRTARLGGLWGWGLQTNWGQF